MAPGTEVRRRPRTRLAIHRGVRRRMRLRLRHGTQTQGTTDRNDRRVASIRQGQVGGATVQAKPVVLRVPRVRSLSTEASAGRDVLVAQAEPPHRTEAIDPGPQPGLELRADFLPPPADIPNVIVGRVVLAALTEPGVRLLQDRIGSNLVDPAHPAPPQRGSSPCPASVESRGARAEVSPRLPQGRFIFAGLGLFEPSPAGRGWPKAG